MLLSPPVTLPLADELMIVPGLSAAVEFSPTKPPTVLPCPPATFPVAWELLAVPEFSPTRPPTVLDAPPVTAPDAFDAVMVPGFSPTSPPTVLPTPPATLPCACELAIWPGAVDAVMLCRAMQVVVAQPKNAPGKPGSVAGP